MDLHPFRRSLFKERQHLKRPFLLFPKMPSAFVGAPTLRTYIRFGVLCLKSASTQSVHFSFSPKCHRHLWGPRKIRQACLVDFYLSALLFYLNSIAHNFYKFNQNLTEWCIYDIISVANSYKKCINCAKFGG